MVEKFSPKNFAQIQGMKKQNHEFFGVFQNLEKKFSKYISFQNFFFFGKIYLERKIYPDFGKPQKFHDFIFFHPLSLGRNLFQPGKDFDKIPI